MDGDAHASHEEEALRIVVSCQLSVVCHSSADGSLRPDRFGQPTTDNRQQSRHKRDATPNYNS